MDIGRNFTFYISKSLKHQISINVQLTSNNISTIQASISWITFTPSDYIHQPLWAVGDYSNLLSWWMMEYFWDWHIFLHFRVFIFFGSTVPALSPPQRAPRAAAETRRDASQYNAHAAWHGVKFFSCYRLSLNQTMHL